MARSLVIVESPAKAKTINKYLGRNYTVKASYGHVMDLPKKTIGILLPGGENGKKKKKAKGKGKAEGKAADKKAVKVAAPGPEEIFEPTYEIIPGKIKIIGELRKAAENAENVYLATDPDREGEAISAHLLEALARKKSDRAKFSRVMFNEITQKAIKAAFEHPAQVNGNLVDAQQARRVLDRLVGYKISPLLWDKVRRGLSAGRVQTVALRLIVEREREIRAFVPKEYWTIHALLAAGEPPSFEAKLIKYREKELEVPNEAEAQRILAELERAIWQVAIVAQKEKRRFAPPPFTTSKLQQAGYNRLRFTAKRTMMLAQRLYEGVELGSEGAVALITYMRTDSVKVSNDALAQVREHIGASYGEKYLPEKPNYFKSKKDAQEAHEAIRPTDVARTPESVRPYLEDDMFKLYQMIWQRFVASQMVPAVFDQTTIDVAANDYTFRATGSVQKFDGYLAAYQAVKEEEEKEDAEDAESRTLPRVTEGEQLRLETIRPEQHFTEPPPRYTEATIVKELEEKGIGRPSTYATIISTIVEREYVNKDQGRFTPTLLGEKVSDLLVKAFADIFDVGFTARMEDELDEIEEGKLPWKQSVKDFWDRFEEDLGKAEGAMESYKAGIPTGQKCEKCGKGELLERISRHGFFLGCNRYPECDFTQDLSPEVGGEEVESEAKTEYCDNCGKEMAIKRGRFGPFLACTGYPDCKTTRRLVSGTRKARQPDVVLDEKCPTCGEGQLLRRHGRFGEF
ncbi:MAG TPA: type I DNA topoisomerase, partial [Candidatus Angelobacter sp.]|nr:type I DNA topoisomerase [Candidatus Angelobacter sp.]